MRMPDGCMSCSDALTGAAHKSRANRKLIEECKQPPEGSQPIHFDSQFAVGYMRQFQLLLKRNGDEYWRMPEYNTVRILFTIVFGLTLGSIYWRIGKQRDSSEGISNLAGALLVANIFLGTSNASTVQPVAAAQRSVMYRERAAGYYVRALSSFDTPHACILVAG